MREGARMASLNAYEQRDRELAKLGFALYAEYLASDLWAAIRARVLQHAKHRCQLCPAEATQVHHLKYGRPGLTGNLTQKKLDRWFVAVCRLCHVKAEFTNGRKTSLARANKKMRAAVSESSVKKLGGFWCGCGRARKHNRPACGICLGTGGHKRKAVP